MLEIDDESTDTKSLVDRINCPINSISIDQLVQVTLFFRRVNGKAPGGFSFSTLDDYMTSDQVPAYLQAKIELHHTLGCNPHSKLRTASLWKVEACKLGKPKAYWHTTPGLRTTEGGGEIMMWVGFARLWSHPACLAQEKADEALED